jgi:hypothetical protein
VGARIAMELRPITAIVPNIAATKRVVIWAWSFFISGAFTGDVDNCQLEKSKKLIVAFGTGFVNLANSKR